jgi:uncharacterized protein
MAYIVDGHNLIPKIPGLSLRALDDEMQLIELLQEFCRVRRKKVELYFDNAPPGQARGRNFGWVAARFIRQGSSADQAINNRLEALGPAARNWIVVSSDQAVQSSARRFGAGVVSSGDFARQVQQALQGSGAGNPGVPGNDRRAEVALKPEEVEAWLKLFEGEPDQDSPQL